MSASTMPTRSTRLATIIRENLQVYAALDDQCLNIEWELTIQNPNIGEARIYRRPGEWHVLPHEASYQLLAGDYAAHIARCQNKLHCKVEKIPANGDYSAFLRVSWEET